MLGSDDSANVTGQATSSRPSGSKRRQEAACLPKPFFVMIKKENKMVLLGAMVLVAAEQCCGSEFVWWTVSPYVPLLSRTVVEPSDFEYRSTVCKLKGKAEARIRRSHALVGGNLNDHMVAYAAQVWRCILIPDDASTLSLLRERDASRLQHQSFLCAANGHCSSHGQQDCGSRAGGVG